MKKHRSLARITEVKGATFSFIIIGWSSRYIVTLKKTVLPKKIRNLKRGQRLLLYCNLGAEAARDLHCERFSLALEPNPDDGLA